MFKAILGNCSYCEGKDVAVADSSVLLNLFELSKYALIEDCAGKTVCELYRDEFKIVRPDFNRLEQLLNEVLGESFCNKKYRILGGTQGLINDWDKFKNELIHSNRFFPKNESFTTLFSFQPSGDEFTVFEALVTQLCETISKGRDLYRARVSDDELCSSDMGCPPAKLASGGRANPVGIAYFYAANDFDTCVSEVRPSISSKVWVSRCQLNRDIRVVDLSSPREKASIFDFEESQICLALRFLGLLELFSFDLCRPVLPHKSHLDYLPTQYLCEYIKNVAVCDGIIFKSSFGGGSNLVLFDKGAVDIDEPSQVIVESMNLSYRKSDA